MRWRKFFRRHRRDEDLREEMNVHLETEIEENLARGYSHEQARRAALLKFGNPPQVREKLWRQNTLSGLDSFARNLKYGARTLRRSPGFAVVPLSLSAWESVCELRAVYRGAQRAAAAAAIREPRKAGAVV